MRCSSAQTSRQLCVLGLAAGGVRWLLTAGLLPRQTADFNVVDKRSKQVLNRQILSGFVDPI